MTATNLVHKHIITVLKTAPGYAINLPGGIHRQTAPPKTPYPFLQMGFANGKDVTAFGTSVLASDLFYLLKVIDKSESEEKATASANWLHAALMAANGTNQGGAYVTLSPEGPYAQPIVEGDVQYQQVGRTYKVWVDLV